MSLRAWRRQPIRPTTTQPPAAADAVASDAVRVGDVAVAVEERPADEAERTFREIEDLRRTSPPGRDPELDARIVRLRHEAFESLPATPGRGSWPPVVPDRFAGTTGCPTVAVEDLDADTLAAGVTHHGCLLVRNLLDPATVAELVGAIDRAFEACDELMRRGADGPSDPWFRPFRPGPGYPGPKEGHRGWVRSAGGVLAADSAPAFETVIAAFEAAGLRDVVGGYLGERPVFSVDKCTLRRVPLDLGAAEWHQDGSFLGEGIRTLNVWLALTPCGGDLPSPGLDLVPRRFDGIVPTGTPGAWFDWSVSPQVVDEVAGDVPVIRPAFQAGDALLFDELFLHRTALEPTMTEERYAIESWFFAGSCYPGDTVPIVF